MQPALEASDRAVSAIPHEWAVPGAAEASVRDSDSSPEGCSESFQLPFTWPDNNLCSKKTIALQTNWQIVTHMSEHLCVPAHGADNHFCLISSSIKEYVLTCQNGKGDDRGLSQWLSRPE